MFLIQGYISVILYIKLITKIRIHNSKFVYNSVHNLENQPCTAVAVRLYTGKTHQIRVAFSHIGHPLLGDTLYGAKSTGEPFALRAIKVVFTHMRSGDRITVQA